MTRSQQLTGVQLAGLFDPPTDQRELVRHYTLSDEDITMIRRRRASHREFIAGVFAEVREGAYTLWGLDGSELGAITIVGGEVSEFQGGPCRVAP